MAIYCERLAGIDGERLHAAVDRAIDECSYFPTVAEIKSRLPEPRRPAAAVLAKNGVPEGWSLTHGGKVQ